MIYRQGDVMLVGVDAIPETANLMSGCGMHVELAHGSATGHTHLLLCSVGFVDQGVLYVQVKEPTLLEHEEHATIHVAPGSYMVVRQLEWDGESRQVED